MIFFHLEDINNFIQLDNIIITKMKIIYGINECDHVVLGSNKYDYSSNETIINLIKEKKKVRFTNDIDRPLDFLPYGIEELRIGSAFNHPINYLPSSLKFLEFSKYGDMGYCCFNQSLDYLPVELEQLNLYYCNNGYYNKHLDNLPPSLKILCIHNLKYFSSEDIPLPTLSNLPESLEVLQINNYDFNLNLEKLPEKLKHFEIGVRYKDANDLLAKRTLLNNIINKNYPHVKFTFRS